MDVLALVPLLVIEPHLLHLTFDVGLADIVVHSKPRDSNFEKISLTEICVVLRLATLPSW